jgi:hypothetical protein
MNEVRVLMGNCEEMCALNIGLALEQMGDESTKVTVTVTPCLTELLKLSRETKFDLCLLFLSGLLDEPVAGEDAGPCPGDKVVESIAVLKTISPMPVIAFLGIIDGFGFPQHVCDAGADCFLHLPCDLEELREAVLKVVPGLKPKPRPKSNARSSRIVKLILTSDLHQRIEKWGDLVSAVQREKPRFILIAGDLLPKVEVISEQAEFFPELGRCFQAMKQAGPVTVLTFRCSTTSRPRGCAST